MIIFMIMLIISIISIPLVYYLFNKMGLKILFIILNFISFIFSLKIVHVFNIDFNLMIISYVALLSLLYINKKKMCKEKRNIKELNKNKNMIIMYIFLILSFMIILLLYKHSVTDLVTANLNKIINNNYIVLISYPIIITLCLYLTYKIYNILKKSTNVLFINVSLTTILVGIIDCIIFSIISNIGMLDIQSSIKLGLGSYLVKIILSIIFIPVISYINKKVI